MVLVSERPAAVNTTGSTESRQQRPVPVAAETAFGTEMMFFSTTDKKGIISSGNSVFVRVSGYSREELIGSPHNILRHPDMPRVVFKIVWEELAAGRPVAAYIKNLGKDGTFYWVMAMLMPCEGGYLSLRIKPSSPVFDQAREVYAELLALEQKTETNDPRRRKEAIEASRMLLHKRLHEAGYADYAAFMRVALLTEVRARKALLERSNRVSAALPIDADETMSAIMLASLGLGLFVKRLVGKVDAYGALNEQLAAKAQFVADLAADVGLFSMNALIAATHMHEVGATLRAVAGLIQSQSATSSPVFQGLTDDVAAAVEQLAGMFFPIAATSLEADMLTSFVREIIDAPEGLRPTITDFGALASCLANGFDHLDSALNGLNSHLGGLGAQVASLKADLKVMRALELQGRIETARVTEASGVEALFRTMAGQIETASREMDDLLHSSTFSFEDELAEAESCHFHVQTIRRHIELLARQGIAVDISQSARRDLPGRHSDAGDVALVNILD